MKYKVITTFKPGDWDRYISLENIIKSTQLPWANLMRYRAVSDVLLS